MNIETVIANIDNTIAGKKQLKNKMHLLSQALDNDPIARAGLVAIAECVELNLQELAAIKHDLTQCVTE